MAKYRLTNKAVEDLNSIWSYTLRKWSEKQADKYYNSLIDGFQEIANNPNLGKPYQGVRLDLFGIRINQHVVFYRVLEGKIIEIIRILHKRMDLKSRLTE